MSPSFCVLCVYLGRKEGIGSGSINGIAVDIGVVTYLPDNGSRRSLCPVASGLVLLWVSNMATCRCGLVGGCDIHYNDNGNK